MTCLTLYRETEKIIAEAVRAGYYMGKSDFIRQAYRNQYNNMILFGSPGTKEVFEDKAAGKMKFTVKFTLTETKQMQHAVKAEKIATSVSELLRMAVQDEVDLYNRRKITNNEKGI